MNTVCKIRCSVMSKNTSERHYHGTTSVFGPVILNIFNSWNEVIENSGSLELLRVQKERIENLSSFNFEKYKKHFQLSNEVLSQTPPDFAVFHPMPINIGIEIDEIAAKNEKFKYAEQLKFAIPARIISYRYALGNI